MAAQSLLEQEIRDRFDAWSIGEASAKPLGKFGSACIQRVRIEPIRVAPVQLNPDLWPDLKIPAADEGER